MTRDTQLFILALVVVIGGGYVLVFAPVTAEIESVRLAVAGFIGTVLTFFFGRSVASEAISQQNGRLERAVQRAISTRTPDVHVE